MPHYRVHRPNGRTVTHVNVTARNKNAVVHAIGTEIRNSGIRDFHTNYRVIYKDDGTCLIRSRVNGELKMIAEIVVA